MSKTFHLSYCAFGCMSLRQPILLGCTLCVHFNISAHTTWKKPFYCSLDSARVKMRWKGDVECTGAWNMLWLRNIDHGAFAVVGALTFGRGPPSARIRGRAARPGVRSERFELFCSFLCFCVTCLLFAAQKHLSGFLFALPVAGHFSLLWNLISSLTCCLR